METLTYKQIKDKVGDSWALLANPVYSEKTGKIVKAQLLFFNSDYRKVHRESLKTKYNHITVRNFGKIDSNQTYVL